MWRIAVVAAIAGVVATGSAATPDPLAGVWVAHDVNGDGSTDRYIFSGPNKEGARKYTLVDSYGSFCETDGPGTGAVLTGKGTAYLDGQTVALSISSYVCANGRRGTFEPPLTGQASLTDHGLDLGYYVATRGGN